MAILETKNLTYTYGAGTPFEKTAVENVNLSVEKGAFVGVIGHTGSGKSTLIQMLWPAGCVESSQLSATFS